MYCMPSEMSELHEWIEGLLDKIKEGRKTYKATQAIRDKFEETCAERSRVERRRDELYVRAAQLEEPAKSRALEEAERLTLEHTQLNKEADQQWREHNDTLLRMKHFRAELLLLTKSLPLTDESCRYRDELKDLESQLGDHTCWGDPPGHQTLNLIEMRLNQMLGRARPQASTSPINTGVQRDSREPAEVAFDRIGVADAFSVAGLEPFSECKIETGREQPTGGPVPADIDVQQDLAPKVAIRVEATALEPKLARTAVRRNRGPNLNRIRERIALGEKLTSELATVVFELRQMPKLADLRQKFPDFRIWELLSPQEQEDLITKEFKPKGYAQRLVLRNYGLTSEETLKKDKAKLRRAITSSVE